MRRTPPQICSRVQRCVGFISEDSRVVFEDSRVKANAECGGYEHDANYRRCDNEKYSRSDPRPLFLFLRNLA